MLKSKAALELSILYSKKTNKNTKKKAFDDKPSKTLECNGENAMSYQKEATALINSLNDDIMSIAELLRTHGCDIASDPGEIRIAYDTSGFSEYRIIREDGIYLYREVSMGGYKLEKRLECRDISASFLILCADILSGMKYKKMICDSNSDYKKILQAMVKNKHLIDTSVSSEDKTNFLVRNCNDLILDVEL